MNASLKALSDYRLVIVTLVTIMIYFPAMDGPFLYDDLPNLERLYAKYNPDEFAVDQLMNKEAGLLGRPVSMLSFILNSDKLPADTFAFKLTNVVIHIVNGLLLFLILIQLLPKITHWNVQTTQNLALIITAVWLLHPLHVSTTLYVVQRMTLLSATFSLLVCLIFISGHQNLQYSDKLSTLAKWSLAMAVAGILGALSKENALLTLPILWLMSSQLSEKPSLLYKRWHNLILVIPSLVLLVYFTYYTYTQWLTSSLYEVRGYTAETRFLSQSRILLDYLGQILIPQTKTMTIFHDDYQLSTSIFEPMTTLMSWIVITLLIGLAIIPKNKIVTFAILWFFIWHIFESTGLALYPYFEHRNYLASIGPITLVIYLTYNLFANIDASENLKRICAMVLIGLFSFLLYSVTKHWRNEERLYTHWLEHHETSRLTLYSMLQVYEKNNELPLAMRLLKVSKNFHNWKNDVGLQIKSYTYQCITNTANGNSKPIVLDKLDAPDYDETSLSLLLQLAENVQENRCQLPDYEIHELINDLLQNSQMATGNTWRKNVNEIQAYLYLNLKDIKNAERAFSKAYVPGNHNIALAIIDLNIIIGNYDKAEKWLSKSMKFYNTELTSEFLHLKQKLSTAKQSNANS